MWDTLVTTPLLNLLLYIYNQIGNLGIVIILFGFLVRMLTHPLVSIQINADQTSQNPQKDNRYRGLLKKDKENHEKVASEQMKYYKKIGINILGSWLPTIIQFPIIIGLYHIITRGLAETPLQLLSLYFHLYPKFLRISDLIPINNKLLWIDLGQPERFFLAILPFGIPTLAIILAITNYTQFKLLAQARGINDQRPRISNAIYFYISVVVGYLALPLASGLSLYLIASNSVGILQYAILRKGKGPHTLE